MDRMNQINLFLDLFFNGGYIKTPLTRLILYPFSIKVFYILIKPKQKKNKIILYFYIYKKIQ